MNPAQSSLMFIVNHEYYVILAVLTVSKRLGTSYQIETWFAVVNHLYLLFSFVKLVETQ